MRKKISYIAALFLASLLVFKEAAVLSPRLFAQPAEEQVADFMTEQDGEKQKNSNNRTGAEWGEEFDMTLLHEMKVAVISLPGQRSVNPSSYINDNWPETPTPPPDFLVSL